MVIILKFYSVCIGTPKNHARGETVTKTFIHAQPSDLFYEKEKERNTMKIFKLHQPNYLRNKKN